MTARRVRRRASPEGWAAHPETVWRFYGQRRAQALGWEPNPAQAGEVLPTLFEAFDA